MHPFCLSHYSDHFRSHYRQWKMKTRVSCSIKTIPLHEGGLRFIKHINFLTRSVFFLRFSTTLPIKASAKIKVTAAALSNSIHRMLDGRERKAPRYHSLSKASPGWNRMEHHRIIPSFWSIVCEWDETSDGHGNSYFRGNGVKTVKLTFQVRLWQRTVCETNLNKSLSVVLARWKMWCYAFAERRKKKNKMVFRIRLSPKEQRRKRD